jgi:hypothetical protein
MFQFIRKVADRTNDGAKQKSNEVYCKLFSDTVAMNICDLRKQDLNGRGGFSCYGCRTDKK